MIPAKVVMNTKVVNGVVEENQKGLIKIGLGIERDIKLSMKVGTGRMYIRPGRNKRESSFHIASAKGKPPAVDTGRLRASISTNWTGSGLDNAKVKGAVKKGVDKDQGLGNPGGSRSRFKVVVGTRTSYSAFLEFGTGEMAARPFIRPAFEKKRLRINTLLKEMSKGLKKYTK